MSAASSPVQHDARVIGLIGAGHFLSHFYMLAIPLLFTQIREEAGLSYAAIGAIVTCFSVTSGTAQIPAGALVDRLGARTMLVGGMLLLAIPFGLLGLVEGYWQWIALAVLAGLGNSVFHPADYTILSASVDQSRLGRAYGLHTLAGQLGWGGATVAVPVVTALVEWRMASVVLSILGIVVALAIMKSGGLLREERVARPPSTGIRAGALLEMISPPTVLLFGFFILSALVLMGLSSFTVAALLESFRLTQWHASAALLVFILSGSAGLLVGGHLADKASRAEVMLGVGFGVAAAMFALIASDALPGFAIIVAMGIAGFAMGSLSPSRDLLVRAVAPVGARGKVFGFVSSGLDLGAAIGPLVFGLIIDRGAAHGIFWTSAVCVLLAMAAGLAAARFVPRAARRPAVEAAE